MKVNQGFFRAARRGSAPLIVFCGESVAVPTSRGDLQALCALDSIECSVGDCRSTSGPRDREVFFRISMGRWIEVEVFMLLSRHVTSCLAALAAYVLIGVAAYWMLRLTWTLGWFPGPTDAWVELVIIYSEFFIVALIFASSAMWFIVDFWKYRKSVSPGGTFFSALLAA